MARAFDNTMSSYFCNAFNAERLIEYADVLLVKVPFDSIVGTGLSGTIAAPILARHFGVPFAIVRKDVESSHSSKKVEGSIGSRWLFVDDMIETGNTYNRVVDAIAEEHISFRSGRGKGRYAPQPRCAGIFLYQSATYEPVSPDNEIIHDQRVASYYGRHKYYQETLELDYDEFP